MSLLQPTGTMEGLSVSLCVQLPPHHLPLSAQWLYSVVLTHSCSCSGESDDVIDGVLDRSLREKSIYFHLFSLVYILLTKCVHSGKC